MSRRLFRLEDWASEFEMKVVEDYKVDKLDERLDTVEERLNEWIDRRLDDLIRIRKLEQQISAQRLRFDAIDQRGQDSETTVEERLEQIISRMEVASKRLKPPSIR